MKRFYLTWFLSNLFLVGCAGSPELPNREHLPVEDISQEALCQVRAAFKHLAPTGTVANFTMDDGSPRRVDFDAKNWAIGISLTPITTTDFQLSLTGSGTNNPKGKSGTDPHLPIVSWGTSAAGLDLDRQATTTGTVTYVLDSAVFYVDDSNQPPKSDAQLIAKGMKIWCDARKEKKLDSQSNLTNFIALSSDMGPDPAAQDLALRADLGIENWMKRILAPATVLDPNDKNSKLAFLNLIATDKTGASLQPKNNIFSYQTRIVITAGANGSFSWTPPGLTPHLQALGLAPSAKRTEDVTLLISFVHDDRGNANSSGKPSAAAASALRSFGNSLFQLRNLNLSQ